MGHIVRSFRDRVGVALLAVAVALTFSGVTALVMRPAPAAAEELEKVPADIVVAPGDTVSEDVPKPLVGGAEVRPDPDGCRHNPAVALTCGVHRIKLTSRAPGYFLRISTYWFSQGNEVGTSVPDVDTYLFDQPTAYMDYDTVGGVSGAMPEVIKVVKPLQTEYDLVIGAYAGAVDSYKIVVQFVNEVAGPSPAAADIVLNADSPPVVKPVSSPMTGFTGQPGFYALVKQNPDACRNDPSKDAVCDVYRIKLNRSRVKDASDFVVITLDYETRTVTPDLVAAVAGVEKFQDPNIDLFLWDSAVHVMERGQVGGETGGVPERLAFTATQDEYDLVVQVANGVSTNYTLTAFMSDEIFDRPFELLDPTTGQPINSPIPDGQGGYISPVDGSVIVPALSLAPIDADDQIAGIGLGTTEQFDSEELLRLGRSAMRNTAATSSPPSAWILWLAMVVAPAAFGVGIIATLRRRHNEAF